MTDRKVFFRSFGGSTHVYYDTAIQRIIYTTSVYSRQEGQHVNVEIDICEDEWQQLMRYGREAGFNDD